MSYDAATWGALALVLTVLLGALTWVAFRRRGVGPGVRMAGVTLLPAAALMTGTLRLLVAVVSDVAAWAARLVFDPLTWVGIATAVLAVLLVGAGTVLARRSPHGGRSAAPPGRDRKPVGETAAAGDPEMAEIEALLRKHGIS